MEMATVLFVGPMCVWLVFAIAYNKPYRHFLQITISVSELYGGTMQHGCELFFYCCSGCWLLCRAPLTSLALTYNVILFCTGWVTFGPEWISGNKNLDGSDPMRFW